MNELIKTQLDKVKLAKLPVYDDSTTSMYIPRGQRLISVSSNTLQVGKKLKIVVEDYIINPYPGFDLHINWNGGVAPTEKTMEVIVLQLMGRMVKVHSKTWEGWLPQKSFMILDE